MHRGGGGERGGEGRHRDGGCKLQQEVALEERAEPPAQSEGEHGRGAWLALKREARVAAGGRAVHRDAEAHEGPEVASTRGGFAVGAGGDVVFERCE